VQRGSLFLVRVKPIKLFQALLKLLKRPARVVGAANDVHGQAVLKSVVSSQASDG